jgi:hypothetical protein
METTRSVKGGEPLHPRMAFTGCYLCSEDLLQAQTLSNTVRPPETDWIYQMPFLGLTAEPTLELIFVPALSSQFLNKLTL